ncbi:Disease resistance RPP8-like protein 3 [Sesamum alatum]|uniref:Disease resistance RPP8-like protein 3 n=1 Tax=Sesamum alatum TaxID=300844 RepID=A0AAE1YP11_9LAMI|nr:Disease resistance RPP8-like protein 3 [Sesamum alatum]
MPVLQKLPELLYLKLDDYAYTGKEIVISHDGFPRLKVLSLHRLTNLRNMQVERGVVPELNRLEICNCPYLESLPEELRFMTSLDELKMVTSAKGASKLQDHVASHIISNIPSESDCSTIQP